MLEGAGDRHLSLHTGADENGTYPCSSRTELFDDISVEVQTDPESMEESDRVCRGRMNSAWCMAGAGFCGDTVSDVRQQDK